MPPVSRTSSVFSSSIMGGVLPTGPGVGLVNGRGRRRRRRLRAGPDRHHVRGDRGPAGHGDPSRPPRAGGAPAVRGRTRRAARDLPLDAAPGDHGARGERPPHIRPRPDRRHLRRPRAPARGGVGRPAPRGLARGARRADRGRGRRRDSRRRADRRRRARRHGRGGRADGRRNRVRGVPPRRRSLPHRDRAGDRRAAARRARDRGAGRGDRAHRPHRPPAAGAAPFQRRPPAADRSARPARRGARDARRSPPPRRHRAHPQRPHARRPAAGMNVLAIDQGTSATKAIVVSDGGRVLGEGSAPVHPKAGPAGAVEQDPQELLEAIVAGGRAALEAAGEPVEAVGVGNQGETVMRWDRATGRPYGPALSWQDRRAVTVTNELADHADRLTEITGLPLDPYFAAPKMTWLRRRDGTDEGVVSGVDAWINHQLTGAYVTDASTASRFLLLDLERGEWSEEACARFGLDPAAQPEILACDAAVGETTAFGPALPMTGVAVDQQAALFAESCFAAGEAKCTYGTGAFILANAGGAVPRSASRLAVCVAWRVGDATSYCLDGQVYTAGSAVSWLQQLDLISEAADIDRMDGVSSDEAVFVPSLAGLGAPFWAPEARGGWVGLSLATRREDLVRAVAHGIAAQVATLGRAIADDLGRPLERLRVDGGLSRSAVLMQAQADLLQVP